MLTWALHHLHHRPMAYGVRSLVPCSSKWRECGADLPENGTSGVNTSDSFMYGSQMPQPKHATALRHGTTTAGTANRDDVVNGMGTRGMAVYSRKQMERDGKQDDHHGGGRKKAFRAAFCCRG